MYKFYIYAHDALGLIIHADEKYRGHSTELIPYDKYYDSSYDDDELIIDGIWNNRLMNEALRREIPALKDICLLFEIDENDSDTIYVYDYIGDLRLDIGEFRKC